MTKGQGLTGRARTLVVDQLRQGISPQGVATTISIGVAIGIFPILGAATILAIAIGVIFRLNQPLLQAVNYAVYPAQVPLVYVFVRTGEWLTGARPVSFSITELAARFSADPLRFLADFGVTGLHGIAGWCAVALPVCLAIRAVLIPLLKRIPVLEARA